jgi:competence protein ComEC
VDQAVIGQVAAEEFAHGVTIVAGRHFLKTGLSGNRDGARELKCPPMRLAIGVFVLALGVLQWQATLPDVSALGVLAAAACVLVLLVRRFPRWRVLSLAAAALAGVCWAGGMAHWRLADALSPEREGHDIELIGVIASLPQPTAHGLRFEFDVEAPPPGVPAHISLAWYAGQRGEAASPLPVLAAGERWALRVRLKRPHGNWNPHGFDYEAWLLERGVRATGYVRAEGDNRRLAEQVLQPRYVIERWRQAVRERFLRVLGERPYAGILVALVIGDQQAIEGGLWQIFARTGTTHLMSISGLHVTLFASLAWLLAAALWRRGVLGGRPLPLFVPAQKVAALVGFASAFGYCLLAGFAVPAQRTLYMLGVVALALWTGRSAAGSRVLALALLLVVLLDPWAVLAPGFWLSFGAVACLFYSGAGRIGESHWLRSWLRTQMAVTLGMLPALLALFQQFSVSSPIANAVAIPLVSWIVTPLALAGALPFADPLLLLAHQVMAWQMAMLAWLAALPWSVWQQHAPAPWTVVLALAGCAWLLMPRGMPARWVGALALLPLFLLAPERPPAGTARIVVLDVGQGLALHVQTATHDLLYDTGPAFSDDANSGNRIIVPYLRAVGVRGLDTLVVTHQDTDHSGGAASVIEAMPVGLLLDTLPFEHPLAAAPVPHRSCAAGDAWEWDGVRFAVLHPPAALFDAPVRRANDLSCVIRVEAGGRVMLLTADIEAPGEALLLADDPARLAAEVLLAPHHGSRTSSTPEFVAAVGARTVIFPVGYRNRFGHPRPDVVERYVGADLLRTDRDGAVTVELAAAGVSIFAERARRPRYWHGK